MIIGIPKETKTDEYRIGLLAVGAELLARDGHTVLLEAGAGLGSGWISVPEPRSIVMTLLGLFALLSIVWRSRCVN